MINIVGLGYGSVDDLTVGAYKMLKSCKNIFVKNENSPILKSLKDEGVEFKDYNLLFHNIKKYSEMSEDVVYAVSGDLLDSDEFIHLCKESNVKYKLYKNSGIKVFIEKCLETKVDEVTILDACNIDDKKVSKRKNIAIINLQDVNKVKSQLLKIYCENTSVYHFKIGIYKNFGQYKIGRLEEVKGLDDKSIIYIKENSEGKKDIVDLIEIIDVLRGENGCPWDKEQTHESIKKDIIEESYEVFDAIEKKDMNAFVEELGDVLFQVLFHASIGCDKNEFSLLDITDGITNKMIYRHPHVFGNINVNGTEEVLINWDELKKHEKNFKSVTDELDGVAKALPALIRAKKIQKKAKKVGFDWDDISGAFDKVNEELKEVKDVYKTEKVSRIREEIGDLLFSCVNVSRFLNVDPEEALNLTTDKFIRRFSYIESKAKEMKVKLEEMSLEDMDKLWDEAKLLEKR